MLRAPTSGRYVARSDLLPGWVVGESGARKLVTAQIPPPVVDGSHNFVGWCASTALAKGDCRCLSIAAALTMAKVVRDQIMPELASEFPPYGFESNKGYPAPMHRAALATYAQLQPRLDATLF